MNKLQMARQHVDEIRARANEVGGRRNALAREMSELQRVVDAASITPDSNVDEVVAALTRIEALRRVIASCDDEISVLDKQRDNWQGEIDTLQHAARLERLSLAQLEDSYRAMVAARDEAQRMLDATGPNIQAMITQSRERIAMLGGE